MVDGFLLNNELDRFLVRCRSDDGPPVANRVEPGKRPLSAMSPTIVFDRGGALRLVVGSAGGPAIITDVAKTVIGVDRLAHEPRRRRSRCPMSATATAPTEIEAAPAPTRSRRRSKARGPQCASGAAPAASPASGSRRTVSKARPIRGARAPRSAIDGDERAIAATRPSMTSSPAAKRALARAIPGSIPTRCAMDAAAKALAPRRARDAQTRPAGVRSASPRSTRTRWSRARLLDRDPEAAHRPRFLRRAASSARWRCASGSMTSPIYRLVHAEADGLPGLIVDRYGDVRGGAAQHRRHGAARGRDRSPRCEAVLGPRAIVLRNDSSARAIEGLPRRDARGARRARRRRSSSSENGARVSRRSCERAEDRLVLRPARQPPLRRGACAGRARARSSIAITGGFAIAAARARRRRRCSASTARSRRWRWRARSAERNGVGERCRFERADVFGELARLGAAGERFDIVIADPPAFVKSKKDLGPGLRGYRKLARLAAALVAPGGILFIASCSHNVERRGLRRGGAARARGCRAHGRHPARRRRRARPSGPSGAAGERLSQGADAGARLGFDREYRL